MSQVKHTYSIGAKIGLTILLIVIMFLPTVLQFFHIIPFPVGLFAGFIFGYVCGRFIARIWLSR